jgi:hypothetical protein
MGEISVLYKHERVQKMVIQGNLWYSSDDIAAVSIAKDNLQIRWKNSLLRRLFVIKQRVAKDKWSYI